MSEKTITNTVGAAKFGLTAVNFEEIFRESEPKPRKAKTPKKRGDKESELPATPASRGMSATIKNIAVGHASSSRL